MAALVGEVRSLTGRRAVLGVGLVVLGACDARLGGAARFGAGVEPQAPTFGQCWHHAAAGEWRTLNTTAASAAQAA